LDPTLIEGLGPTLVRVCRYPTPRFAENILSGEDVRPRTQGAGEAHRRRPKEGDD